MKTIAHYLGYLLVPVILSGCTKDDPQPAPGNPGGQQPIAVNLEDDFAHAENDDPVEIRLILDTPAASPGQIGIRVTAEAGLQVTTVPPALNNVVTVDIEKGDESVSFTLVPEDDDKVGGMKNVAFAIASVSAGYAIGDRNTLNVEIIDDELAGKPRSFETSWGGWTTSTTYFYRPDGLIDRVEWKAYTPGLRSGVNTYYYRDGKIARINSFEGKDEFFYWENDRIVSSEYIENGTRRYYREYDYDEAGNIGAIQLFWLQPNGEYVKSYVYIYLYFDDGNLYKQLIYVPADTPGEYELISTQTHENYLDKENYFPVNQVVPTVQAQLNLPGSFRIEQDGSDQTYLFSYEFDEKGRAIRRSTNGEVTTYTYY